MEMKHKVIGLAVLGACLCIGFLLQILACALFGNNWYPMFGVICYFMSPFPIVLGGYLASVNPLKHNEGRGFMEGGIFTGTFFLVSGISLPLVLWHAQVIEVWAMVMSLAGASVVYTTILAYLYFFHGISEEDAF